MKRLTSVRKIGLTALLLTMLTPLAWADTPLELKTSDTVNVSSTHKKTKAVSELLKQRHRLIKEAVAANQEIIKTIDKLNKNDKHAAYKSLADASGKLDVVLARDPSLKLAPIAVRMRVIDLETKPKEIKKIVSQARKQLDDGHIQAARALLNPLVSEIRISTDYIPMATYPAAIKRAVAEIEKGKLKDAKRDLYVALSTIATNDEIIPLPPLNAETDVLQAERLAKKDSKKNKKQIVSLLDDANQQLALAGRLGYGKYKDIKTAITTVKGKIHRHSAEANLFDDLKTLFKKIRNKV